MEVSQSIPLKQVIERHFLLFKKKSGKIAYFCFFSNVTSNLSEDPFVKKPDNTVIKAKNNEEWRREYMTLLMRDRENLEKGRAEGRAEGRTDGYIANIRLCQRFHMSKEAALNELKHAFSLSDAEAQMILNRHWDISL